MNLSHAITLTCALAGAAPAGAQCLLEAPDKVIADDARMSARLGTDIDIDGDVMVVGAWADSALGSEAGAAYVFRVVEGEWRQEQRLMPDDPKDFANFGNSVAISGDRILVGAPEWDKSLAGGGILRKVGKVYVFEYDGLEWVQTATLEASTQAIFDEFGESVDLDGDRAIVGAFMADDACFGEPDPFKLQNCNSGAAYIFEFDGAGWVERAKLLASDIEQCDKFGNKVAIQGDVAVVAAANEGTGSVAGSCDPLAGPGQVYVFRFDGDVWSEEAILNPAGGRIFRRFGEDVAISGERILVGAQGDDAIAPSGGAAYIYRADPGPEPWALEQKIQGSDTQLGDFIGASVALDGDICAISANFDDYDGFMNAGSGYVFLFDGAQWIERARVRPFDPASQDFWGHSIALGAGRLAVGSISDDHVVADAGSAYIFTGMDDCNANGALDACDIATGVSRDDDGDGIPDECQGCYADCDGSGALDFFDFLCFQNQFGAGDPAADCDGSGTLDFFDFLCFQNAFATGCP
ncbi:MAG: GC-type dockerin domain-anchored protein [Phycisphaerales bacterium JB039]